MSLLMANRALIKSVGEAFDPDAQAFIDAANITDGTQQGAINDLVIGLKADSIWTPTKAIYPFVGGTASQHKFNLKDPRDLDGAFRLVFSGGLVHSSTGILPNGSTGVADTFLVPLNDLPSESMSLSYYSRTNANTGLDQIDIGTIVTSVPVSHLWLSAQYITTVFYARNSSTSILADTANADARGLYDCSKTSNGTNTFKTHKNGVVQDTNNGLGTNPGNIVYIFCAKVDGLDKFHTNRECAFASIGEGLTDADSANLYTRVQVFQTTLGRQV